ncbi:MAG: PAS domain-containing protein, partial [Pirellulales bacterium]
MTLATEITNVTREGLTFEQAEALLRRMAGDEPSPSATAFRTSSGKPNRAQEPSSSDPPHTAPWSLPPQGAHVPAWDEPALRAVLESVPDAVIAVDRSGAVVLVNRQTEDLFGYPRSELLGRPIELLLPERFRVGHVEQRETYFADPKLRPMGERLDLWARHRSGREFPVEISLSPLRTEADLLVTATVRDISQRRREELQLRHAEARYRTLVEEIPAVTFMASLEECASHASELY